MHRVDPKRRRATMLRVFAYALMLTLSTLTTIILLYIALGYGFDRESGHLVRSGLLLVDNRPQAAQIYINDELRDNASPGRFVLTAGEYDLRLARTGYREWSKKIHVAASSVREVRYPLLLPDTLSSKVIGEVTTPELISQSQDKKLLLMHRNGENTFSLITLSPETLKRESAELPEAITRENGRVGAIRVIEWALDNKHVLLQHTKPGGAVELVSLNVTKPSDAVNISGLYGGAVPSDIHYVGGNTNEIYGIRENILRRYSLKEPSDEVLLQNVRSYEPYGDDMILFDRLNAEGLVQIGIWKDAKTHIVRSDEGISPSLLAYAKYEDNFYFVVSHADAQAVHIYRNPLDNPPKMKQSPFKTLSFTQPQKIAFSDSAQFLLVQNGARFMTYDFDDFKRYSYDATFELAPETSFSWLGTAHVLAKRADGVEVVLDYDGSNEQELVASSGASRLYFSDNYTYLYRAVHTETNAQIESVSLTLEK